MASPAKNNTSSVSLSSSSSSPSIPTRPNPKPRNSETGDLMRRSFRGSPFPTDLSRRNSIGRECARVDLGDKENQNDKDQISNLVKAPKGAKHFMSPTISAVSKISPSPRKKILSDKNEVSRSFDKTHHHQKQNQVRSSVSFCDVISIIGEEDKEQDLIFIDEKKQIDEEESHDITVTDFDENHGDKSCVDLEDSLSLKISPLPPSGLYTFPLNGSQEVDPLVAPYDPKKNYLSPRPQFLHYKPNPRIEQRFDECKQLEELFTSESSSYDTDLSAEESQQEEEVVSEERLVAVQVEEETQVEIGEEERLEAVEIDEEEEEVVVGESTEEEEESVQFSKPSRFKASKLLGWILALGVAYMLLVSSPNNIIQEPQVYKSHISPDIARSARESFEQLSGKLGMWAESSLVYMDKLISSLGGEEEGYGSFQFHNLTDLLEDNRLSDSVFQPTSVAGLLVDIEEEHGEDGEVDSETNLEADYEEDGNEFEKESEDGEVDSEMVEEFDEQTEVKTRGEVYSGSLAEEGDSGLEMQRDYEENDQKNVEEGHESETRSAQNDEKNTEEAESNAHQLDDVESAAISGDQQVVDNAETGLQEEGIREIAGNSFDIPAESGIGEGSNAINGHEQVDTDLEEESELSEVIDAPNAEQKKAIVLFSSVMVLLATAAAAGFFLLAKKKAKPVVQEDGEPTTISDTKEVNLEHVPIQNLIKEKLSSLHFQEDEKAAEDRNVEVSSFPSEMSFSFRKNRSLHSCNSNKDGGLKEYQSGEGGKKSNDSGESMASSASEYSIGSVSYGSFTTYEKIQKRSGRKEEEMVTPVRRSSRIRNHQH